MLDNSELRTDSITFWYNTCTNGNNSLRCKILTDNPDVSNDEKINFTSVPTNAGLFYNDTRTEKGYRVYYYRGNVNDNNLIYKDMCFKIIRIDEFGNVRLAYNGETNSDVCNNNLDIFLTDSMSSNPPKFISSFNTVSTYNQHVGFMFSSENSDNYTYGSSHSNIIDSAIKKKLNTWFKDEAKLDNDSNIVDAIYCNDRTIEDVKNTGYGQVETTYSAKNRLAKKYNGSLYSSPTFICPRLNSAYYNTDVSKATVFNNVPNNNSFTVSSTLGNGKNTYPVGLLTADEVAFAGGVYDTPNTNYSLYSSKSYYTMTPFEYKGTNAYMFVVEDGKLKELISSTEIGLVPVITIKGDITITGKGTTSSPYKAG